MSSDERIEAPNKNISYWNGKRKEEKIQVDIKTFFS